MGLAVVVGALAEVAGEFPKEAEDLRGSLARVNRVLIEHGLAVHGEPSALPRPIMSRCPLESYPYSFLHRLRRIYAYATRDPAWIATPAPEQASSADAVIDEVSSRMESHLLCHSDCEGFYVPIRFRSPIIDERIQGEALGSSYGLRDELRRIAPTLGIHLESDRLPDSEAYKIADELENEQALSMERLVWLSLWEAARLSIEHRVAIVFA